MIKRLFIWPGNIVHTISTFLKIRKVNESGKFKRDFEPKKYTFARSNKVVLTRPGAVRPESDHPFPAFCPVCVMRLS